MTRPSMKIVLCKIGILAFWLRCQRTGTNAEGTSVKKEERFQSVLEESDLVGRLARRMKADQATAEAWVDAAFEMLYGIFLGIPESISQSTLKVL